MTFQPVRSLALVFSLSLALPAGAEIEVEHVSANKGKAELLLAPRSATLGILTVRYQVGGFDDDQMYGLTRLTQRALIDSNDALGAEFLAELYAENASLELDTGIRTCSFILTAPKGSFTRLATKLLKGLHAPKLNKSKLARARRLTFDDQRRGMSLNDAMAMLGGEILLTEVSPGGGDYRNPPRGDRASVAELKLKNVQAHASRYFVPANATVAAAGAVDRKLEKMLKKLRGGKRHAIARGDVSGLPRELERFARRETHLHAQVLDLKSTKDVAAARILEALLWEKILWQLRGQGVTYTPSVLIATYDWLEMLVIYVPVSSSRERGIRVEPLLRKYLDQVIVDVPDEDFMKNRDYVLGLMTQKDSDPTWLAEEMMRSNGRIAWHNEQTRAAVEQMSKADFLSIIRQWLGPERSANYLFGRSRAKYKRSAR